MKAELVELATKHGTQTVVLISTEVHVVTKEETRAAVELAVWLVDEGWTVTTRANSPIADAVRRAAQAMRGSYIGTPADDSDVAVSRHQLPPRARSLGGIR